MPEFNRHEESMDISFHSKILKTVLNKIFFKNVTCVYTASTISFDIHLIFHSSRSIKFISVEVVVRDLTTVM